METYTGDTKKEKRISNVNNISNLNITPEANRVSNPATLHVFD